ncbi:MAG: hypothetical protein PHS04_09160 [Tissierellia bacterium]|nr:hypothetical protein [Tissierellia bacterium]
MKSRHWTAEQKKYVSENAGKLSFEEMASHIGKTKNAVHLFVHRNRIQYKPAVKVNLLIEILDIAFTRAEYFKPTTEFFKEIGMTQMRFWSLYRGEVHPTEDEYETLKKHFNVSGERIFENRQLSLFD